MDKNIDVVLFSPYKRAVDTVREFAENKNMDILIMDDFRERKIDDCWIEDFHVFSKSQFSIIMTRHLDIRNLRKSGDSCSGW